MNVKRLIKSGILNPTQLAARLWPQASLADQKARMSRKIAEKNGQRLTEKDLEHIERIIREEGELS